MKCCSNWRKNDKQNFLSQKKLRQMSLKFYSSSPRASHVAQNLPANTGASGDSGSILGSGRSPGGGNGNTFQYSCWNNPMDRGAWWVALHRGHKKSGMTGRLSMHTCTQVLTAGSANQKSTLLISFLANCSSGLCCSSQKHALYCAIIPVAIWAHLSWWKTMTREIQYSTI